LEKSKIVVRVRRQETGDRSAGERRRYRGAAECGSREKQSIAWELITLLQIVLI
jgi:hypothetical protein